MLHELTVIGEAAARIPVTMRERFPSVPWSDIVAFRNLIVHEYFGLSWPLVWDTATREVPDLKREIVAILRSEFPDSAGSN